MPAHVNNTVDAQSSGCSISTYLGIVYLLIALAFGFLGVGFPPFFIPLRITASVSLFFALGYFYESTCILILHLVLQLIGLCAPIGAVILSAIAFFTAKTIPIEIGGEILVSTGSISLIASVCFLIIYICLVDMTITALKHIKEKNSAGNVHVHVTQRIYEPAQPPAYNPQYDKIYPTV